MTAFDDTWRWSIKSERAHQDVVTQQVGIDLRTTRRNALLSSGMFLYMMAYRTTNTQRMAELSPRHEAHRSGSRFTATPSQATTSSC